MKYLWIILLGLIMSMFFNMEDVDIDLGTGSKNKRLEYVAKNSDYRPWNDSERWGEDDETMLEYRGRGSNGRYTSRGGSRRNYF